MDELFAALEKATAAMADVRLLYNGATELIADLSEEDQAKLKTKLGNLQAEYDNVHGETQKLLRG